MQQTMRAVCVLDLCPRPFAVIGNSTSKSFVQGTIDFVRLSNFTTSITSKVWSKRIDRMVNESKVLVYHHQPHNEPIVRKGLSIIRFSEFETLLEKGTDVGP